MSYRLWVKGQESGWWVSLNVTFWSLLTTSKTLSIPKNTGTKHAWYTNHKMYCSNKMWSSRADMTQIRTETNILLKWSWWKYSNVFEEIHCPSFLPRLTLSALGIKLNEYWRAVTEKQARERAFQAMSMNESEDEHNDKWVQLLKPMSL